MTREEYFTTTNPAAVKWRTARTFKRCWECRGEIEVGHVYFDTGIVAIDKFITAKLCSPCAKADAN